jgi:uncharacterized protein YdaU (DUF1376 family)
VEPAGGSVGGVNYVELHIGDYDKNTAHLTACEDGIYGRLLRRYYDTETELPLDVKAVQRLVRARAKDELAAVVVVLNEFFEQTSTGWRHERCEGEIAKYREKRAKAQRSANARWDRSERNANASAAHDGRNAHQTPDAIHQASNTEASGDTPPPAAVGDRIGQFEGHDDPQPGTNPVAPFAVAMNRLGFRCTSLTPDLVAYQQAGGTVDHLTECAQLPDCTGKPAAYAIRIARRELAERAPAINGVSHEPARARGNGRLSAVERVEHAIADRRAREAAAGRTFDA